MSTTPDERDVWMLQARHQLPAGPGPWFWTGQDYTSEPAKALRFRSDEDARAFLRSHRHLRASLNVAVIVPPGES